MISIPILLYHAVSDQVAEKFRPWSITPQHFAAHMALLRQQAYTLLTITELVERMTQDPASLPERTAAVTFDDGFEDFFINALPILDQYQVPSTLYVPSACIGRTSLWLSSAGEGQRPVLSWDQLRQLASHGVEIGAHTLTHPVLDVIQLDQAREEIAGSKAALEQGLGYAVGSFAYPHGYHNRETRAMVQQAGFSSACAVKNTLSNPEDDIFALARITVTWNSDAPALAKLLRGEGLASYSKNERLTTTGWRVTRRFLYSIKGAHASR